MEIRTTDNTYLCLRKRDKTIENKMIFIYAGVGYGKSLAVESLYEEYHRAGYTVLILSDVKKEFEFCYAMFEPQEKYHLRHLEYIGKPINPLDVKIYHPFTFSIPTRVALPEIQFYGFSLKRDLQRREWTMIAESDVESDTIRLLMNTCRAINRNDGLYPFLHKVEESIITKKRKKMPKPDPSNFYLRTTPATSKSLQDIASYLRPYLYDYFLLPDDSPLVLDWKNILNDNKRIHCFTTKWIGDEKLQQLIILCLFNSILRHKDLAKNPVLIVIPEIKELVPTDATKGYKKYLAQGIRDNLTIMRSMGKGFSGLFDSQVWSGVEESVRNIANLSLYGQLGGEKDIESLSKALKYNREISDKLKKSDARNSYLIKGHEEDSFTLFFPGFMHAEQKYRFEDVYRSRCLEKMQNYSELVAKMKKDLKEQVDYYKNKVRRREEEELVKEEARKKEKEVKRTKGDEVGKLRKGKKEVEDKSREKDIIKIGEMKTENPELSWRKLADKCLCDPKTAKKYYELYLKKIESENVKDIEEKVLEELEDEKEEKKEVSDKTSEEDVYQLQEA